MADSRIDTNSSATTPNTYAEGQLAIQDAQMARERASLAAANAAFTAAKNRPVTSGTQNPGIQATTNALGVPTFATPNPGATPKPKARKSK